MPELESKSEIPVYDLQCGIEPFHRQELEGMNGFLCGERTFRTSKSGGPKAHLKRYLSKEAEREIHE